MAVQARILTFSFELNDNDSSKVTLQFGAKQISRDIPKGHGLIRASAILDKAGELVDAEIVTQPT
jgi:hypothetical protein